MFKSDNPANYEGRAVIRFLDEKMSVQLKFTSNLLQHMGRV
jgi:hypothetical protein